MRSDARYHLMASVHHAAKADAYGKLGYRGDQARHAVRALDHRLMFGAGQYDEDDMYGDDPDTRELGRLMRESHGDLYPPEMRPQKPRVAPVVYTPPYAVEAPPYAAPIRVSSSQRAPLPGAPVRVGSWDATGPWQGVKSVPVTGAHLPLHAPPYLRVGSSLWDAAPQPQARQEPLHGTPVVLIKPGDFFKPWQSDHRAIITRELKKRNLSYLNKGRQVTINTPMPDSEVRPIVERFLASRLRAWDEFVQRAEHASQMERDAPEFD